MYEAIADEVNSIYVALLATTKILSHDRRQLKQLKKELIARGKPDARTMHFLNQINGTATQRMTLDYINEFSKRATKQRDQEQKTKKREKWEKTATPDQIHFANAWHHIQDKEYGEAMKEIMLITHKNTQQAILVQFADAIGSTEIPIEKAYEKQPSLKPTITKNPDFVKYDPAILEEPKVDAPEKKPQKVFLTGKYPTEAEEEEIAKTYNNADEAVEDLLKEESAISEDLLLQVQSYAAETWKGEEHVFRWQRVLVAFGILGDANKGYSPMTADEAQQCVNRGWQRWVPVLAALKEIEADEMGDVETAEINDAEAQELEQVEDREGDEANELEQAVRQHLAQYWKGSTYLRNWKRVAIALGIIPPEPNLRPMTWATAERISLRTGVSPLWSRVAEHLKSQWHWYPLPEPITQNGKEYTFAEYEHPQFWNYETRRAEMERELYNNAHVEDFGTEDTVQQGSPHSSAPQWVHEHWKRIGEFWVAKGKGKTTHWTVIKQNIRNSLQGNSTTLFRAAKKGQENESWSKEKHYGIIRTISKSRWTRYGATLSQIMPDYNERAALIKSRREYLAQCRAANKTPVAGEFP